MNNQKILTIAIPAYKNIKTLEKAIISIMNQNSELLKLVDVYISIDGSENTEDIIKLLEKYEKIKYSINNPAFGMAKNWNNCIYNSKTKFVALLHDDDYLLPNYLEEVMKLIQNKHIKFDCVLFDHYFEVDGKIQNSNKKVLQSLKNGKIQRVSNLEYWLGGYNYKTVPTCGILFDREVFISSGGYSVEEGYSVDESFMEEFIRMKHKVIFYAKKLAVYTYTTNSNLSSQKDIQRKFLLENIEYRQKVSMNRKVYKCYNKIFGKIITLYYAGPWIKDLMPEIKIKRKDKILLKVYKYMVIGWHALTYLKYRNL